MKSRSLIKSLLATTGCIIAAGSFLPATAGAQTAAPEMAQEQSAKDAPAGMDNIVVTARRREERLQDVPATVSAFGEQALRNYQVSDMTDLTGAVPNLIVNNTGGGVNSITPFIRGIGQDSFPPNLETPIGVYFDDVYLGRTQGALIDLLDMERIEVLRGPQGTLYGRNNTGGAIKYVPRAPSLTTTRVMADLKVGNFDRLDAQVSASIPAIPGVLGIRIDAGSRYQQGYLDGVDANGVKTGQHFNGHNRQSGRISALWQPADTLTVQLSADIDHDNSAVNVATPISCAGPANTNCSLYFGSAYKAFNPKGDQASYDSWGTTLKIGYDMGFADVKSVSAYRQFDTFNPSDLANNGVFTLPVEFYLKQHQLSQEFQFTSKSTGPFTWIGGLFYFSESIKQDTANFLGFGFANNDSQSTDSYAAYGEVGYEIVEGLKLTAGLRYTKEEKTIDRIGTPSASSANSAFNVTAGYKGSKVTPKFGLDWKVTPDMLAYAIYSKGFKGGGFASAWPATVTEAVSVFQPEDVTNYEAGLKTDWLDHRLRINLAGFYVNYNNLQQLDLDPQRGFVVFIRESRVYGGELELTFRPDSHWNFAVTGGMLNSKTTKNNNPNSTSTIVRYAPKFQGRFFGEYRTEIGSSGTEFFMSGDVQHTGAYSVTDIADTSVDVAGYTLINSSLGFEFENGRYRIALAGKNLGDKEYWRMGIPGLGRFYGAPREVYINFTYKM